MSKKKRRQKSAVVGAGIQTDADVTEQQDTGSEANVLSGDTEALSDVANADSESVKELAAEGQYYEAEVVDAIENAPASDQGELKTREVPEDDVRPEYLDPNTRERQT